MEPTAAGRLGLILAATAFVGCGGSDGGGPTEACSLTTSLSGAVDRNLNYDDTDGCGGAYNEDNQLRVLAYGGIGRLLFRVVVLETAEDAVGLFKARVEIVDEDSQGWATADGECSVDITQNEFVKEGTIRDVRRIRGSLVCSAAAKPDSDNEALGTVEIADGELYSCVLC